MTIKKMTSKNKKQDINIYAKNMRFMNENLKYLLSELTNSLGENQWLKVSNDKYKPINHKDTFVKKSVSKTKSSYDFKPIGSFYSKGGWLFHEDVCCKLNNEIILIEVDYNTIYRITGKEPFKSPEKNTIYKNSLETFMDKYGKLFGKDKCSSDNDKSSLCNYSKTQFDCKNESTYCKWSNNTNTSTCTTDSKKLKIIQNKCKNIKTMKKCQVKSKECFWEEQYKLFNWGALYNDYNGFAIYPYPEMKLLKSYKKNAFAFYTYDVETLVLWNHKPVIKYYNLGTIENIIKESGVKGKLTKQPSEYYKTFIPKLIQKIKNVQIL